MISRYPICLIFFFLSTFCLAKPPNNPTFKTTTSLGFIENKGQIIDQKNKSNPAVLYLLTTPGFNVQLRRGGFSYDLYRTPNNPAYRSGKDQRFLKSDRNSQIVNRCSIFESNQRYTSHDSNSVISFHRIDIDLLNATPNPVIETSDPSSDYLNYFTTGTPVNGIRSVRHYKTVTYKNIYPGIDLEFMMTPAGGYKYNFVIRPGGRISDIRLNISGVDNIQLTHDTLQLATSLGNVDVLIPESYFQNGDLRSAIKTHFKEIKNGVYGFVIDGEIPEQSTLIIDPTSTRLWGTYYGGVQPDYGRVVLVDNNHNVILCGQTDSYTNIATAGAYDTIRNGTDVFIAKFTAGGVRLWGTYYGGIGLELLRGAATDMVGNIYVGGMTDSDSCIATPGSFQDTTTSMNNQGPSDGFLAKFSPNGWRIWGTYYGGYASDDLQDVATDKNGNVYVAGETAGSAIYGTPGTYQPTYYPNSDGYIGKFDSTGARLWGTFYGHGCGLTGCSVDSSGIVYAAGFTNSPDTIASSGAYQTVFGGGLSDAFLVAFTSEGQRLWATYYGGPMEDGTWANGDDPTLRCTADNNGFVYLTSYTKSASGIASPGAYQTMLNGTQDGFIAKFNSLGQRIWGTYYGGSGNDWIYSCSPGWTGDVFFTGETNSPDSIATPGSYMPVIAGSYDAFLVKFNSAGQRQWGTYFGGNGNDMSYSSRYVVDDTIYFSGNTASTSNIASGNGHQTTYGGQGDAFLEKFIECWPIDTANAIVGPADVCQSSTTVFYSTSPLPHAVNYQWVLPPGVTLQSAGNLSSIIVDISPTASSGNITVSGLNKCGDSGFPASLYLHVHQRPVPVISGNDTTCSGNGKIYLTAPGKTNYQWSISSGGVITGGGTMNDYSVTVTWNTIGLQTVQVNYTDTNGCEGLTPAQLNVFVIPGPPVSVSINASANNVCAGTPVTFTATPGNGGPNPFFQWKVNGINTGPNNPVYTYAPLNGDIVSCVLTSDDTCSSNNPAASNQVIMVIISNSVVGVSISASANPVCAGTSVTFLAIPTNGGSSPSYQWKVNNLNVGIDSPNYSFIPNNGDIVTCILTSNVLCPTGNPATSNTVTMIVNPNLPVSVSISASANPFCQGNSVTFTAATMYGGPTPFYQWKVNGINVGPDNPVYSYSPNNGDVVSCVLTSNIACPTGNPATSNPITMIVNANLPAGLSITASTNPFCPGNSVTFSATPVNGGTNPVYQWKVNGANSGSNSPTYVYNPGSGDLVSCVMTSNLSCVTGNPATSNTIIMSGTLAPAVTFTACFDTITSTNAKPFRLKGGIPLGGTYSGAGVSAGIVNPAIAGVGNHQINYTYTNVALCSATVHCSLLVVNSPAFTCGQNLTDIRDNKVYQTVQIGSQCWLAEDLNYGTEISETTVQRDNCIPEKYHNPASSIQHPASVYQWDEIMNYDESITTQGLCPPGWHVPSEADWNTLFANYINNGFAASPLKYSGFSGFNALLSGARHMNKSWDLQGFATFFWSSTSHGTLKAWSHGMNDTDPSVSAYPSLRNNAFSVRCLKDIP